MLRSAYRVACIITATKNGFVGMAAASGCGGFAQAGSSAAKYGQSNWTNSSRRSICELTGPAARGKAKPQLGAAASRRQSSSKAALSSKSTSRPPNGDAAAERRG